MIKKCPKCENAIAYVTSDAIDIGMPARFHGVAHCCPRCNSILSVGIDPLRIRNEIIAELKQRR